MKKHSSEKVIYSDKDKSGNWWPKIYSFVRANWLAFFFALIIAIITIVAIPILYTLDTGSSTDNKKILSWNIRGRTILNAQLLSNRTQLGLGNVSALGFGLPDQSGSITLYALDSTNGRIISCSSDKQVNVIVKSDQQVDGKPLSGPSDLYVNSGVIYVADTNNHRIVSYDLQGGTPSVVYGTTGVSGTGNNQLKNPKSIAISSNRMLYIADYGNDQIVECNLDTKQKNTYLTYVASITNQDRHQYITKPISIKYDQSSNSLVIAQEIGYNVVRWKIGEKQWTLIAGSASSDLSGTSRTLFNQLCSVEIDSESNTYVDDCYNQRIQLYQGDGTKGTTIAGVISASGNNSYLFNTPNAIKLDQNRNLYVADTLNNRIQCFPLQGQECPGEIEGTYISYKSS